MLRCGQCCSTHPLLIQKKTADSQEMSRSGSFGWGVPFTGSIKEFRLFERACRRDSGLDETGRLAEGGECAT